MSAFEPNASVDGKVKAINEMPPPHGPPRTLRSGKRSKSFEAEKDEGNVEYKRALLSDDRGYSSPHVTVARRAQRGEAAAATPSNARRVT